jgi:hypothetical protein
MAKAARKTQAVTNKKGASASSEPKFPYTTRPSSLRRLLKEIPKKPRPEKFDMDLLRSWGFADTNDYSMLRVLKAVNLLNAKNEPTEHYNQFMSIDTGAAVLGPEIKRMYAPMFQASHEPYNEGAEKLQNLFHIHSGGGERSIEQQMQTFKALCESAIFDQQPQSTTSQAASTGGNTGKTVSGTGFTLPPTININLHIHLPENKTRRDYEDMIEDIGRHIFGRSTGGDRSGG